MALAESNACATHSFTTDSLRRTDAARSPHVVPSDNHVAACQASELAARPEWTSGWLVEDRETRIAGGDE